MVKFVGDLDKFLFEFYPKELSLILFGHTELLTKEIYDEYLQWRNNRNQEQE